MNAFKKLAAAALVSAGLFTGLTSFTTVSGDHVSTEMMKGNIEFRIVNDYGGDYKYCANGGHNTITKGTTKIMSFSEGTEIKYVSGSSCGGTWFKVTSSMNGKTFKLSELIK